MLPTAARGREPTCLQRHDVVLRVLHDARGIKGLGIIDLQASNPLAVG